MSEPNLQSQNAVLRATIQIKRKDTGKVDEYEIFGVPIQEQPKEPPKEPEA